MKKSIFIIFLLVLTLNAFSFVKAEDKIEISFFFGATCPHCALEETFLRELVDKYPEIELREYNAPENIDLLMEKYQSYAVPENLWGFVPISFIGERYFLSFDEKVADDIENYVLALIEGISPEPTDGNKIRLPIIGEIDISKLSLPFLAMIFGFFDGFDVCSLSALVLVLTIVLSFRSRFKVLFFGMVFILINTLTYGLLIIFWSKVFNFLASYIRGMEVIIGVLAIVGGLHFLRKFFKIRKTGPVCEVETGWGKGFISKASQKIKELFKTEKVLYIILGLLLFDIVVSIIEFPCSGALPVVFAGILSQADVSTFQYFLYLAIFLLFYLIDELIVFLIAVFTMKIWTASPKFVIWSNFILAITLFFLGFYYLFDLI